MDAFAVSVCKGLSLGRVTGKHMALAGAWFGGFQALMPILGFYAGSFLAEKIDAYDHWVAFVLLVAIGVNMIRETFTEEEEEHSQDMDVRTMFFLAVATSIDALAVGVSLAFLSVPIWPSATYIGCVTFLFAASGIWLGSHFGARYEKKAERLGGAMLILIGLRILLEGLH